MRHPETPYEVKRLEREPSRYHKGNGKVAFTRPFLVLGKVTFDEHANVLERYWKGIGKVVYHEYLQNLNGCLSKLMVIKGLISLSIAGVPTGCPH